MDVKFSAKTQTLISSVSLASSSSHFHLPNSIRRDFLGCGSQPRPSGLRSRGSSMKLGLRIQSPRCLFQDSLYDNSILVVAAAVATFATFQLIYLNYSKRRRQAPEFTDQDISDIMVIGELCKQADNMEQEVVGTQCFSGEKGHASDIKDAQLVKLQTIVLTCEEIISNEVQPGYNLLAYAAAADQLVKTTTAIETPSSSVMVNEVEAIDQGDFAAQKLDLLREEQEEPVATTNVPNVLVEPTVSCSANPLKNKRRGTNRNIYVLEHISSEGGDFMVSNYGRLGQCAKQISDSNEDKQPDLTTISYFKNLSRKPPLHVYKSSGTYSRLKPSLKGMDVLVKGSPFTADYSYGRLPIICCKKGPISKGKELIKVHGSTTDIGRSLLHKNDSRKFSHFPQLNGNVIKDGNDPTAYIRTYNCLLRDARLKNCIDLLESMERKGFLDMDKVHHATFLKACKSQKAVKEAIRFCKLIRKPTLSTFNMLLSVCASSQDFDGAFQVMLLVKEARLRPDCKLYTTLISTCAKSGKVDAMFEVFHEMVNAGVEPNVNTYGALIDGCARAGQVAKAFGAYGIMSSKKVQPDRVVFNALITACGQSGAVDRAFDVLAEMRAEPHPIDPDHVTVGALMKTCIQVGQLDRAHEVYKMLHLYNIKGTPDVYTIAVNSCSQTGNLEFALSVYDDMKKNGVVPDEMFLSTLIDVAGHAGKVDAAFDILQDARTKGIKLGNVSYSSLMGACCNAKNWQKALELYEDIKNIKLLPPVSMLNALVTSLCDGDQLLKAVEVLNAMKEAGVRPNMITYSILIVACERKDEAEVGFILHSQAKMDSILPNLIMCRCLTGLCLRSFQKAYSLGEPIVTFISGKPQIDSKWTSLAIMVYRETISAGVIPPIEVFSQVLGCLQFPRDSSLRDRFIENLGINFDASRCSNISSLLDGFGEYDTRSFSVLEEAASLGVVPRVSFKESPIVVDARKLPIHTVEVYLLTILKGLKHRLAAGARLPNITILLPIEKTVIESAEGERTINVAGRVGQAVGSLLRRLGLPYQGNESYGKIRINGLSLRRWCRPNHTRSSSIAGRSGEMIPTPTRLAKGIVDQQRSIRSTNNLSLE